MSSELLEEIKSMRIGQYKKLENGAIIRANSTAGNGRTRRFFTVQTTPTDRPTQVRDAQDAITRALGADA